MQGDSHGDPQQAHRILAGALTRHADAPVGERAAAWAYLAELRVRLDDGAGAREAAQEVRALAADQGRASDDREAVDRALGEVAELDLT